MALTTMGTFDTNDLSALEACYFSSISYRGDLVFDFSSCSIYLRLRSPLSLLTDYPCGDRDVCDLVVLRMALELILMKVLGD